MPTYSIVQAKDQLSQLVDDVLDGQQVTITRDGKVVAELKRAISEDAPKGRPVTADDIAWMRQARESLPKLDVDTVAIIREMRGHLD